MRQNFIEYQEMLANEYAGLDVRRLLRLGELVVRKALGSASVALASPKFSVYRELLEQTVSVLDRSANDLHAVNPEIIDKRQQELSVAHGKLSRKTKVFDDNKEQLADCTALLLQVIYYLKTEDPIYIIGIEDNIQQLDGHILKGYQDQLALISRLKKFLKI